MESDSRVPETEVYVMEGFPAAGSIRVQNPGTRHTRLLRALISLSTLSLGLSCGAMLLITLVLFPWLAILSLSELRAWSALNGGALRHLMYPVGTIATLATVAAYVVGRAEPWPQRAWLLTAALAIIVVGVVTLVFNEPVNQLILGATPIADAEFPVMIDRWIFWNWARLPFALLAFYAANRCSAFGRSRFSLRRPDSNREAHCSGPRTSRSDTALQVRALQSGSGDRGARVRRRAALSHLHEARSPGSGSGDSASRAECFQPRGSRW
ncbi:MAG TPA: DUF1772 domain-containing protein [Candidatus Binataceae bacterium]